MYPTHDLKCDCFKKMRSSVHNNKIRVMQLVSALNFGGLEMLVVDLADKLDKHRYEPVVCCLQMGPLIERIRDKEIKLIHIEKKPGLDYGLILKLAKIVKQERIDILHSHNKAVLLYGVLAAKIAGTPLIHTRHGRGIVEQFNILSRKMLMRRTLYHLVDLIVSVSHDAAKAALQIYRVPKKRLITIHNGVNVEKYSKRLSAVDIQQIKQRIGIGEHDLVIGNVARLSLEKAHDTLLEAFAIIRQNIENVKLVIIGDGPMRGELEAMTVALGVASDVLFLGMRRDIPELLNLFDVFVLSSVTEGVSLTLLEAMSAELPIVATNVGGNPEVVLDEVTGIVVPPENSKSLANAIVRILTNRQVARKMGQAGKKRVIKHFSLECMVRSYEDIYDFVLAERPRCIEHGFSLTRSDKLCKIQQ